MDYLPPVACVELTADRFYVCLIDVNGGADLPRQLVRDVLRIAEF